MKHLGDITKINGADLEPVDCICFGSPCQNLSQAGNRKGLDGSESSLFFQSVRIFKEIRENELRTVKPLRHLRFLLWENVEGARTSNGGGDFRVVLEELCRIKRPDYSIPLPKRWEKRGLILEHDFSIAWRLFNAAEYGVPQRRKRFAVLCDLDGQAAGDILFLERYRSTDSANQDETVVGVGERSRLEVQPISESVPRYFESEQEAWKGIARRPSESVGTSYSVKLRHTGSDTNKGGVGALVFDDVSATLSTHQDQTIFAFGISPYASNGFQSDNPNSGIYEAETSRTLDANNCCYPGCNQGGIAVVKKNYITTHADAHLSVQDECASTLTATDYKDPPIVVETFTEKRFFEYHEDDTAVTLRNKSGSYGGGSECLVVERKENG